MCSSYRVESRVQSSYWNCPKRGSPLPMSLMSSTARTSRFSVSISSSGSSAFCSKALAPSSSPASIKVFFSSSIFCLASSSRFSLAARLLPGSRKSACIFRQSWTAFCQAVIAALKSAPGTRSSARCVCFFSRTHDLRREAQLDSLSHTNVTSSKPSDFSGNAKLAYDRANSLSAMSGMGSLRHFKALSSSVSSTGSSGSSSFSSSSTGLASSSSSGFSSASSGSSTSSPILLLFAAS
mmetsp:Transcript_22947/g.53151  ORF Transcript_22947/g.53151 Transcript_22947/m.53151 type:complete len:238 (+) Transcript_22947:629-1342(+)